MQSQMFNQQIIVSSTANHSKLREKAVCLAEKLQLPFKQNIEPAEGLLLLLYDMTGLSLCQFYGRRRRIHKVLFVDFINGKNGYRLAHNCTIRQPLAKAVGIKPGIRPTVIDATAGLGGDGFVLASLGCRVLMYERNPVMSALLEDGLQRARESASPQLQQITSRIALSAEESFHALGTVSCDTIYLDPMFPQTGSTAAKKRSMQLLRQLTGDDSDQQRFLSAAETGCARRITVKRSRGTPYISGEKPDYSIVGKSCRYDIYLRR